MPQRRWTEGGVFTLEQIKSMSAAYDVLIGILDKPDSPYAAVDRGLLREMVAETILSTVRKGTLTSDRLQAAALRRLTELLPG